MAAHTVLPSAQAWQLHQGTASLWCHMLSELACTERGQHKVCHRTCTRDRGFQIPLQTAFLSSPSSSCRAQDILAAEFLTQTNVVNMHSFTPSFLQPAFRPFSVQRGLHETGLLYRSQVGWTPALTTSFLAIYAVEGAARSHRQADLLSDPAICVLHHLRDVQGVVCFLSVRLARMRILAIQAVSLQAVVRSAPESPSLTITLTIKGQTLQFNRCPPS